MHEALEHAFVLSAQRGKARVKLWDIDLADAVQEPGTHPVFVHHLFALPDFSLHGSHTWLSKACIMRRHRLMGSTPIVGACHLHRKGLLLSS